ncbi:TPA: DUF89 family protein [Candidatus Micrarchaeota archaeon]|nr:DUF89 family protein [Candidatus Micrarchaeota archaeon]
MAQQIMMRLHPECIPCLLSASLRAARLLGIPEGKRWEIVEKVAPLALSLPRDWPPLLVGGRVQRAVEGTTGAVDPFRDVKRTANERALKWLGVLRERIAGVDDPLEEALRVAAAGNMIDFGVMDSVDLEETLAKAEEASDHFRYREFSEALSACKKILYIGDNAGEIVWDMLVVEELLRHGVEVVFAVRSGPALNDATLEDARLVGLDRLCRVIETGAALPGITLAEASEEFRREFEIADIVLAKGMGNFEGLSGESEKIFFLLVAKCIPVARELGVPVGTVVLRRDSPLKVSR